MMSDRARGFTLIDMLLAITLLGLLVAAATPSLLIGIQRRKEEALHDALDSMRHAIDAYKLAADEGQIDMRVDDSGYPPSLQVLVDGVVDKRRVDGQKIYFLRRIPADPMSDCNGCKPESQWKIRPYQPDGNDVFDVSSKSDGVGLNGVPYKDW
jgi:general secretion pathway protein G